MAKMESIRLKNNLKASNDTIRNYIDKDGNSAAEIRALILTLDEVRDSLDFEKNKPPVTIIRYETIIKEIVTEVPVYIIDTVIGEFSSAAVIKHEASWGKSWRKIKTVVPYLVLDDSLTFGDATVNLEQNIFLTASIVEDKKTKEVFVNLKTDYPGTTFNNAQGILIEQNDKGLMNLMNRNRKTLGLGIQMGIGITGGGVSPYIGVGLNYTPKFLQW